MIKKISTLLVIFSFYLFGNTQLYTEYITKMSQKYVTYVYLAAQIYDEGRTTEGKLRNILGETWRLEKYTSETNGFQAGLYYNKRQNKYIVSIGGTTANPKELNWMGNTYGSLLDLGTDLTLLSNLYPESQSESALNFIKTMENTFNIKIDIIVGHSLGGGLAAYAGLYYNIKTYTVNSAPIPFTYKQSLKKFYINHAVKMSSQLKRGKEFKFKFTHEDKITNIMSNNDPMTNFNKMLKRLDKNHFNPTNPVTPLNALKLAMLIPIELRLDYIFVGKKIELSVNTGHGSSELLKKMKDAIKRGIIRGKLISYRLYNKIFFLADYIPSIYKLEAHDGSYNDFNPKKPIKTEHFINMVIEAYNRSHLYSPKISANLFSSLDDQLYKKGTSEFKDSILLKDAIAVIYYLFDKTYGSKFQHYKIYAMDNQYTFSKRNFIYFIKKFNKKIKNGYKEFYYLKIKKMYFIYGDDIIKDINELNKNLTKARAIRIIYNYMKYYSSRK